MGPIVGGRVAAHGLEFSKAFVLKQKAASLKQIKYVIHKIVCYCHPLAFFLLNKLIKEKYLVITFLGLPSTGFIP